VAARPNENDWTRTSGQTLQLEAQLAVVAGPIMLDDQLCTAGPARSAPAGGPAPARCWSAAVRRKVTEILGRLLPDALAPSAVCAAEGSARSLPSMDHCVPPRSAAERLARAGAGAPFVTGTLRCGSFSVFLQADAHRQDAVVTAGRDGPPGRPGRIRIGNEQEVVHGRDAKLPRDVGTYPVAPSSADSSFRQIHVPGGMFPASKMMILVSSSGPRRASGLRNGTKVRWGRLGQLTGAGLRFAARGNNAAATFSAARPGQLHGRGTGHHKSAWCTGSE